MSIADSSITNAFEEGSGNVPRAFPVVGIGASAGGLEAISRLLKPLPPGPEMAFLVVQHLDPSRGSLLTEILSKACSMSVTEAEEGMVVTPGSVYVIPPGANMALARGALVIRSRAETSGLHMPIDYLFRSMSRDLGRRAIGVILSGGGTDGAFGVEAIKGEGGITFAQDEDSAQHDSMPRSAISTGCVDYVLDPETIARELMRIGSHNYVNGHPEPRSSKSRIDEDDLHGIFRLLRSFGGSDFSLYKRKMALRRIERRMALRQVDSLADYHGFLRDHADEVAALYQDMLIRVTSFFRDPQAFEFLQERIFPDLIRARPPDQPIRFWVAGCSTGEEVYSLAIALLEAMGDRANTTPIKILASDVSESALERARSGLYIENIAMDLSPERLRRFFSRVNNYFQVGKAIRDLCIFSRHDLTRDPPFARLDLVSCRNVMIYFDLALQRRIIPRFHYALRPGGYLMLGNSETIGSHGELFAPIDRDSKLYRRNESPSRLILDFNPAGEEGGRRQEVSVAPAEGRGILDLQREADRLTLSRYAPPGVLIDESLTILQFRGQTGSFLEPSPGIASLDLTKMVRGGLVAELRAAIAEAKLQRAPVRKSDLQIREGDSFRRVAIEVIPLRGGPRDIGHFLVLFEGNPPARSPTSDRPAPLVPDATSPASADLQVRLDLEAAQHYIRSLQEEHDATRQDLISANEDVLSSNEELQSVNEELQSTNEELQTAKEEMQSANEELVTVNEELRHRIGELDRLNDDLSNLIQGVDLPIVMVDRELRIRRFTPPAEKVMNLIATDIGRPIGDIRPNIDIPDLGKVVAETIDSLIPTEHETRDRQGCWYSLRIRPYVTSMNRVEGATIAFLEIDALKRGFMQLKEAREYADAIVETVWEPLVVLDGQLRVRRANQAFYQTFGISQHEAEDRSLVQILGDRWIRPELGSQLVDVLVRNTRLENFQIEVQSPGSGRRIYLLNAHRIYWEGLRTQRILLAMADITDRERQVEESRLLASEQAARAEAERSNRNKDEFLAMLAHELRNPLAPILSSLLVLRSPDVDAAVIAWAVEIMERQVRHMSRLIEDLLDVSRITQGKIVLRKENVELSSILLHAVEIARPLIEARRHRFTTSLPREPVWLDADPARLEQVVANLLNNAAKYTPEGGRISLEAETSGREVAVRVRDSGIGISPELQPTVFDLFMQGNQSLDRPQGGLGIGLTLVRTLVEMHGGSVEVRSEGAGRGSEFIVRLPGHSRGGLTPSPADTQDGREALPRRVLLVDDNVDAAITLARLLSGRGHDVRVAHNGQDALKLVRDSGPEVIFLDIGLPGMDGYEIARRIRREETATRPMLVALTGYGQEADRLKARETGFDLHLIKPVDVATLQAVMESRRGDVGPGGPPEAISGPDASDPAPP